MIPQLAPAMLGARWLMPLMGKVSLERDAFGLIYIHFTVVMGSKLLWFFFTMVLNELMKHPCVGIGMGDFLFERVEIGFKSRKIIADGFEKR